MTDTPPRILVVDDDLACARANAALCLSLSPGSSVSITNNAYFAAALPLRWDILLADVYMPPPRRRPNGPPLTDVAESTDTIQGAPVSLFTYSYPIGGTPSIAHGGFHIAETLQHLRNTSPAALPARLVLVSGQLTGPEKNRLSHWTGQQDPWCVYYDKDNWLSPGLFRIAIRNALQDWHAPRYSPPDPRLHGALYGNSNVLQRLKIRLRELLRYPWVVIRGPQGVGRETLVRNVLGQDAQPVTHSFRQGIDLPGGFVICRDLRYVDPQALQQALYQSARRIAFIADPQDPLPPFLAAVRDRILDLPSISQRPEDIATIAQSLALRLSPGSIITPAAIELLKNRPWPGETAELAACIATVALYKAGDPITEADFPGATAQPNVKKRGRRPDLSEFVDLLGKSLQLLRQGASPAVRKALDDGDARGVRRLQNAMHHLEANLETLHREVPRQAAQPYIANAASLPDDQWPAALRSFVENAIRELGEAGYKPKSH